MDEQKKQKLMLVLVVVLVLGAGSFWYFGRDSGGSSQAAERTGPVGRKKRDKPADQASKDQGRKKRKPTRAAERSPTGRRERVEVEEKRVERKRRGRGRQEKKKKQKITPAA